MKMNMSKMNQAKLTLLALGCSLTAAIAQTSSWQLSIAPGPFGGTRDSLTNYTCPDWFRDAKFGIWAHWGPQVVSAA
jgi:alpha-L-fucosidase